MESRKVDEGVLETFERMEGNILTTFAKLIGRVTKRRAVLIVQLRQKKKEFLKRELIHKKEKKELENLIKEMTEFSIKENRIIQLRENEVSVLKLKLTELEEKMQKIKPFFDNEGLESLLKSTKEFGFVKMKDDTYGNKTTPIRTIGRRGTEKGELDTPHGIAINKKQNIYIADHGNSRIQIFSMEGKFVNEFGKGDLSSPYAIAFHKKWVFVSDWGLRSVAKFENTSFKLIIRSVVGKLNYPFGLTVSNEGEVLVADRNNHRVAVFNMELKLIREFGKGKLKYPCDVKIRFDQIFVADNSNKNNIHIFSKTGILVQNIIRLENGFDYLFFTFDLLGNIILTDYKDNSIQIFTVEGEKTHHITCSDFPTGIAVTKNNNIICANFNSDMLYVY